MQAFENSVDPVQMLKMQHLIRVYMVCLSVDQFLESSTGSKMDF